MPHERIVISAWRAAALPSKSKNTDIIYMSISVYRYGDMEIWRLAWIDIYRGIHIYIYVYMDMLLYMYICISVDRYPSM
jgi:hypothetical protein